MRHATHSDLERTHLLQVQTRNRAGDLAERFVALSEFELWAQLMASRHQMVLMKQRLCLWSGGDGPGRSAVLAHAPVQIEVDRLRFTGFDDVLGIRREQVRYSPRSDTPLLAALMLRHLNRRLNDVEVVVTEGQAFAQAREEHLVDSAHPLSGGYASEHRAPTRLDYIELSCSMPRGLAPERSTMRS